MDKFTYENDKITCPIFRDLTACIDMFADGFFP